MKFIVILFLTFTLQSVKAQTLSYYNYQNDTNWDCITIFNNSKTPVVIYNSSKLETPVTIAYINNQVKDGCNISIVHLGADPTNYILVQNKQQNYFVLTDQKQMFRKDYYLDSKIYNLASIEPN